MKRTIQIDINGGAPKTHKCYSYDFASTKDIKLLLGSSSATVKMRLDTNKDESAIGSMDYSRYANALGNVMRAWMVVYGRFGEIEDVTVSIDSEPPVEVFDKAAGIGEQPFICHQDKRILMSPKWQDERIMKKLLSMPKSNEGIEIAALNALVLSKKKSRCASMLDESARFMYLWMAMNGFYLFLVRKGKEVARDLGIPWIEGMKETQCIRTCFRYLELGNNAISDNVRKKMARRGVEVLRQIPHDGKLLSAHFDDAVCKAFIKELRGLGEQYQSETLEGFFLLSLPYYFRCELVHANKPMPLFAQSNDPRCWCLPLLSDNLECFLDDNLWTLFDEDYQNEQMLPRLEKVVRNWS